MKNNIDNDELIFYLQNNKNRFNTSNNDNYKNSEKEDKNYIMVEDEKSIYEIDKRCLEKLKDFDKCKATKR